MTEPGLGHGPGTASDQFQFVALLGGKCRRNLVAVTGEHADMVGNGLAGLRVREAVTQAVFAKCDLARNLDAHLFRGKVQVTIHHFAPAASG